MFSASVMTVSMSLLNLASGIFYPRYAMTLLSGDYEIAPAFA